MRVVWVGLAGLALLGGGCAAGDPYQREGMWQPTGANSRNLAAMVANPRDLIRGRGERGSSGAEGAGAVLRLASGRPVPLPASGSQPAGAPGGQPGGPPGAAP